MLQLIYKNGSDIMYLNINNQKIKINFLNNYHQKLKGLMFKKEPITEIYCFSKCNSIHTFFMKQNIDICMTTKDHEIIYLKENLAKNKIIWLQKNAYYTYELPLGTCKYLKINQQLKTEKN